MSRYIYTIVIILGTLLNCSFNYNTSDAVIVRSVSDFADIDLSNKYKGKYILVPIVNKESNKTEVFCYNECEDVSYMDHNIFHRDHGNNKNSYALNYIHSEYKDTTYRHTDIFIYDLDDFKLTMSTRDLEPMISHMKNYKGVEIAGVLGKDFTTLAMLTKIRNEERIN